MKGWISIDEINELEPGWTQLHCDTRDFHLLTKKLPLDPSFALRIDAIGKQEEFLISEDDILPMLKRIKAFSGGDAQWRCLAFKGGITPHEWVKYIRFYKTDAGIVVASTMRDTVYGLPWRMFTEENLDREHLNAW